MEWMRLCLCLCLILVNHLGVLDLLLLLIKELGMVILHARRYLVLPRSRVSKHMAHHAISSWHMLALVLVTIHSLRHTV